MTFSIKLNNARFTKYFASSVPQIANLLGFYDFQQSELENLVPGATNDLTRTGSPAAGTFGRLVGPAIGYDTGFTEPNAGATYFAFVKGKALATGVLFVGAFAQGSLTPRGMSLGAATTQAKFSVYSSANVTVQISSVTIDSAKYYMIAARRGAPGANVTTDIVVFSNGTPLVTTGPGETIQTPRTDTTVKIGYNSGNVWGVGGPTEIVAAAVWARKLTNTELQEVYNHFVAKYPTIPMA